MFGILLIEDISLKVLKEDSLQSLQLCPLYLLKNVAYKICDDIVEIDVYILKWSLRIFAYVICDYVQESPLEIFYKIHV